MFLAQTFASLSEQGRHLQVIVHPCTRCAIHFQCLISNIFFWTIVFNSNILGELKGHVMFQYCIPLFGFKFSVSTSCHAAVLNSAASLGTFMSRQQWVFMTAVVITTHRWSQPRDSPHGSADQSCCPELTPASVRSSNSTPEITCMSTFGRSSIFINSQSKTTLAAWLVDTPQSHLFF